MSEIAVNDKARLGVPGISIGKPLDDFLGALRGVPTYTGSSNPLPGSEGDSRFGPSNRVDRA